MDDNYIPVHIGVGALQCPSGKQVTLRDPIKVYRLSHVNDISCPAMPVHG